MALAVPLWGQVDTEPTNNTLPGGDGLGLAPMQARLNLSALGAGGGDVDFYSNMLLTGDVLAGMTTPLANFAAPDTVLGGFNPAGLLVPISDDAGSDAIGGFTGDPARGSLIRFGAGGSGVHSFAISGFPDFDLDGLDDFSLTPHPQTGAYALTLARFPVSPSVGGDFADSPGNSAPASADSLNLGGMAAVNAVAELTAGAGGDLDFYSVFMNPGDILSAFTTPLGSQFAFDAPDTILGIFHSSGVLIDASDDAGVDAFGVNVLGPARGSAIRFQATTAGLYYLGVTGFNDFDFLGDHAQAGLYGLTASLIPEPSSAIVLLLAGIGLMRRRCA
jgi:hypothetical protein